MATLFVVATPIGNLEDLSPRAARVLKETTVVATESVNRTRKLLSHLGLKGKKLISCREANRNKAAAKVVQALNQGCDVALVSDAGTPGVSDPGAAVFKEAAAAGHRLCPIPGPSALAAGLSVAGEAGVPLIFLGFLPAKAGARRRLLAQAGETGWTTVMFEAPHRLDATARDLLDVLGDRPLVLAREISKVNEEVVNTTCAEFVEMVKMKPARGEITLVVGPDEAARKNATAADEDTVGELLKQGLAQKDMTPSRLAQKVAAACNMPRKDVYQLILRMKKDTNEP